MQLTIKVPFVDGLAGQDELIRLFSSQDSYWFINVLNWRFLSVADTIVYVDILDEKYKKFAYLWNTKSELVLEVPSKYFDFGDIDVYSELVKRSKVHGSVLYLGAVLSEDLVIRLLTLRIEGEINECSI